MAEAGAGDIEWIEEPPSVRPRVSHIRSCCAEGCKSKGYRLLIDGERVQYFPFPLYDFDLCNRWASAVQLDALLAYEKAFVCSKHFRPSDYKARLNDESKKTLRRTAIPSLEAVVGLTPSRPAAKRKPATAEYETSEESADESVTEMKTITTMLSKKTLDGDNLTVLVVKDPNEPDGAAAAAAAEEDLPAVMKERLKLPLVVEDLLESGPPYPWRKQGIEEWVNERMPYHEEYLQKTRDAITDETVASATAEQDCQERLELLALIIIKKGEGRLTLKNFVRAMVD